MDTGARLMAVVAGIVLIALAALAAVIGLRSWPLWSTLRRVRTTTPERLTAAARDGGLDGRMVAVTGIASSGPDGFLSSAVNDESCVWHRHIVHQRQVTYRETDRGMAQRSSRAKRIADQASPEPFTLWGSSIKIEVHPAAMRVDRPRPRPTRVLPGPVSQPFPEADAMLGLSQQSFRHREWILRPGDHLFVLGEVEVRGPWVALRRPARGASVISTRSVSALRRRVAAAALAGIVVALAAAIAGVVVLVAALG